MRALILIASIMLTQISFAQYRIVSLGKAKAEKISSSTTFHVGSYDVDSIGIRMTSNDMHVHAVYVEYGSGYVERLRHLERRMRSGDIVYARVDNRDYVRRVRVEATSGLIGSRGRYEVVAEIYDGHYRPHDPYRPPRY